MKYYIHLADSSLDNVDVTEVFENYIYRLTWPKIFQ